ncbi:unnamed protein product [Ilex paraguariensis]|uniref:O-acyltransferase WSD1 C-terminal domain-containing protein n=1 Tax=Ilex paraguariensis TaxID=185542 RepID=A0ABC8TNM8_9AQUA
MGISNLIGLVEQVALANHPVKGIYFAVVGAPQSLGITVMSYVGKLRVAVLVEKGFIDPRLFKSCIENAFELIFKAANVMMEDDSSMCVPMTIWHGEEKRSRGGEEMPPLDVIGF